MSQKNISEIPAKGKMINIQSSNIEKPCSVFVKPKPQPQSEKTVMVYKKCLFLIDRNGGGNTFVFMLHGQIYKHHVSKISKQNLSESDTFIPDTCDDYVDFVNTPKIEMAKKFKLWWPYTYRIRQFSSVSVKNYIYISGGYDMINNIVLNRIIRYDINKNTWLELTHMNKPRMNHASTIFRNTLIVAGGETNIGKFTASCEKYDFETDCWYTFSNLPLYMSGHSILNYNDKYLFVSGGYDNNKILNHLIMYENLNWIELDKHYPVKMRTAKENHGMAFYDGRLIFMGGNKMEKKHKMTLNTIESITIDIKFDKALENGDIITPWDYNFPKFLYGRHSFGVFQFGKYIFCFGGTNEEKSEYFPENQNCKKKPVPKLSNWYTKHQIHKNKTISSYEYINSFSNGSINNINFAYLKYASFFKSLKLSKIRLKKDDDYLNTEYFDWIYMYQPNCDTRIMFLAWNRMKSKFVNGDFNIKCEDSLCFELLHYEQLEWNWAIQTSLLTVNSFFDIIPRPLDIVTLEYGNYVIILTNRHFTHLIKLNIENFVVVDAQLLKRYKNASILTAKMKNFYSISVNKKANIYNDEFTKINIFKKEAFISCQLIDDKTVFYGDYNGNISFCDTRTSNNSTLKNTIFCDKYLLNSMCIEDYILYTTDICDKIFVHDIRNFSKLWDNSQLFLKHNCVSKCVLRKYKEYVYYSDLIFFVFKCKFS
ncbi:hypothetical protein A3Q56_00503 [Intoshia linei]|uniref:Uncharacterized protein n=1 Tax=Intoshia linei TaxID=1819745 RepID=A0A177BBL5_9BILA|nr:hypothetical protein A3Q56_00503 [Intoshia linei]